jgi:lycopene cyclase domain-containing protein
MTYLQFHFVFLAPALLVAGILAYRAAPTLGRRAGWAVFAVPPIALLYTTPWDNYLVWKEVWFYGADRVLGTIGYVPIEEYLFFLLQPLLAGATLYWALGRMLNRAPLPDPPPHQWRIRLAGLAVGSVATIVGMLLLRTESGTYMGLILTWASPVPAIMWAVMGPAIWRARRAVVTAIVLPSIYLWIADRMAIGLEIWTISERYTLGWNPAGLPVEEATFFALTTVISVFGVMLFLIPGMSEFGDA